MASFAPRSGEAWRRLMEHLRGLDEAFAGGDRAVTGETATVEGYRHLATALGLALDIHVHADPGRPKFVDINAPDRPDLCWGGDNTDASYQFCAVDPARTYRISGRRGDSVYFSVTVYNQPEPGLWSDRIVGTANDTDLDVGPDGYFELIVGPARPDGWTGPFVELTPDAAHVVTRDYQSEYSATTRTRFWIEALDPPATYIERDGDLAQRLDAARRWLDQQFLIVPLATGTQAREEFRDGHNAADRGNAFADPYRVPARSFGWSAADAVYAFGAFDLAENEALVVTHEPPVCRFWNLNTWNPFMAKFRHDYERVSVNVSTAVPNSDGTITAVVARRRLDHPNAISTLDHANGMLAFRWFLAADVPARPSVEVVATGDAPRTAT